MRLPISCFARHQGARPPPSLEIAESAGIPVLGTHHQSSTFISLITKFLEEQLLPTTHLHGVLVDVLGVGVLLTGKSIGKSECALELVIRGHRLVADDMVFIKKKMPASLVGQSEQQIQHLMEIRGLGIINIKDLYGVSSIREKRSSIWCWSWRSGALTRNTIVWVSMTARRPSLGVDLPHLLIPVRPGLETWGRSSRWRPVTFVKGDGVPLGP